MFSIFNLLKIAAILAPLAYMFYVVSDYKSQAVIIAKQKARIARVEKQNEYWEGRYSRIVGLNRNKKSAIAKFEMAIDKAGCRRKVDRAFKEIEQNEFFDSVFKKDGS